jgi:predicted RNA-binding protein YlxR (DUF448 family)
MTQRVRDRPIRTCVGCGASAPRGGMIRLQPDAAGELRVVGGRSIAGRTAYLHAQKDCVRALARSKRLFRSLRKQIDLSERERFVKLVLESFARDRDGMREIKVG